MKRILLAVLASLVVAVGGAGVWATSLLIPDPIPQTVLDLEDAMALPEMVAIGHLDVGHLLEVERIWRGEFDADALADGLGGESLVDALWHAGVDPAETVDHWLVALVAGESTGTVHAVVGEFPVDVLLDALSEQHQMAPSGELWILTREDVTTCHVSAPIALWLSEERAIFGEPELVELVVARLEHGAAAEVALEDWHLFRSGRTGSFALLLPDELAGATSNPFASMAAAGASEELGDIRSAYLGAGFAAWPPGIDVEIAMDGASETWPTEQLVRFTSWRDELVASQSDELPSLAGLLAGIGVEREGTRLSARVRLDDDLGQQLGQVMSEAISTTFVGAGLDVAQTETDEEQIVPEEELRVFVDRLDPRSLSTPPGEPKDFATPGLRVAAGPAWIHLASRRLRDDADLGVELEIAANTGRIPNLAVDLHHRDDAQRIQLFVTSVANADGLELLAPETCGPHRNGVGANLSFGSESEFKDGHFVRVAPEWSGTKAVRLTPGHRLEEVARIRGHLAMRLPTSIETIRVDAPSEGEVVEREGLRVVFKGEPGGSSLEYEVSGASDRILEVWARNGSGQALDSRGASSSSRMLRPGKSISRSFAGEIASVDLLVVAEELYQEHPFELIDVAPHYADWTSEITEPVIQARADFLRGIAGVELREVCNQDETHADVGPFVLCVGEGEANWGSLYTRMTLWSPVSPAVEGSLSALEVRLDAADLQHEGEILRVATRGDVFSRPEVSWGKPYPQESLRFSTSLEPDDLQGQLRAIYGELVHRLPRQIHPLELDVSRLGNEITYDNGVHMQLVELGAGKLVVDLEAERERVVSVEILDENGSPLPTRGVTVEPLSGDYAIPTDSPTGQDAMRLSLEASSPEGGRPAGLRLLYALEHDVWTERFAITLKESTSSIAAAN